MDAEVVGAVDVGYGGEGALGGEEVGEEGFEGGGGCGGCCGRGGGGRRLRTFLRGFGDGWGTSMGLLAGDRTRLCTRLSPGSVILGMIHWTSYRDKWRLGSLGGLNDASSILELIQLC